MPPLFWISFPFRSPQSTEQSSLCHTVGSHLLPTLYIVVYIYESQSPNSSYPHPCLLFTFLMVRTISFRHLPLLCVFVLSSSPTCHCHAGLGNKSFLFWHLLISLRPTLLWKPLFQIYPSISQFTHKKPKNFHFICQ